MESGGNRSPSRATCSISRRDAIQLGEVLVAGFVA
jgi:hypothetical protein